MRPVCLLDRAKNLYQSDGLHFISDSLVIRHAHSTRTCSCASDRALVRLNTVGLLKRASLERKKSDGAYRALYSLAPLGFA